MTFHRDVTRKLCTRTAKTAGPLYDNSSPRLIVVIAALAITGLLLASSSTPVLSQGVQLIKVDVAVLGKGYRASKLIGTEVTNDKNEKIGKIDDLVVDKNRVLFAVLQVGGFLGVGGRLVAVPSESLVIDDTGRNIQLPGASKEELQKLAEFKYRN
jgi:sporulation protein YlmC with PRC-barrel domain